MTITEVEARVLREINDEAHADDYLERLDLMRGGLITYLPGGYYGWARTAAGQEALEQWENENASD